MHLALRFSGLVGVYLALGAGGVGAVIGAGLVFRQTVPLTWAYHAGSAPG